MSLPVFAWRQCDDIAADLLICPNRWPKSQPSVDGPHLPKHDARTRMVRLPTQMSLLIPTGWFLHNAGINLLEKCVGLDPAFPVYSLTWCICSLNAGCLWHKMQALLSSSENAQ